MQASTSEQAPDGRRQRDPGGKEACDLLRASVSHVGSRDWKRNRTDLEWGQPRGKTQGQLGTAWGPRMVLGDIS